MIYIELFFEFFKIGLFAIGGGMATIPFLQELSVNTGWFDQALITEMIAISESTPGPIGINMATYVGYNIAGIYGGIIASIAEIIPSIIIVISFSKSLDLIVGNKYFINAFYGMRPAVAGLIAYAAYSVICSSVLNKEAYMLTNNFIDLFDFFNIALFICFFYAIKKYKKHPTLYIAIGAILGIVLGL